MRTLCSDALKKRGMNAKLTKWAQQCERYIDEKNFHEAFRYAYMVKLILDKDGSAHSDVRVTNAKHYAEYIMNHKECQWYMFAQSFDAAMAQRAHMPLNHFCPKSHVLIERPLPFCSPVITDSNLFGLNNDEFRMIPASEIDKHVNGDKGALSPYRRTLSKNHDN